jgi:antitoxin PrlF
MSRTEHGDERPLSSEAACPCGPTGGCRIEAILSVDERGQMVLPKDVRQKAGIGTGDKLALIGWERDGRICCPALVKADELSGVVRDAIGPLMRETPGS